ncbi:hypothetical protein PTI98_006404 [Pleurotus ostreatus]|nr:hypothetical protein PTI98_006404 [Pleurotus ostreatus]
MAHSSSKPQSPSPLSPPPPTAKAALKSKIELLNQSIKSIQHLRQIPPLLLKPPLRKPLTPSRPIPPPTQHLAWQPTNATHHFEQFRGIHDQILSEPVQQALAAARDSEKADSSDLTVNARRETRKRRRPPSPSSPQPYISTTTSNPSLFPPPSDTDPEPLKADQLAQFIRDFNRGNDSKLHIWLRSRSAPKDELPVVVRFTLPDVLTAYITLNYTPPHRSTLVTESVSMFAPREQATPQSQSEFTVYQILSQQISKMIQSCPFVPFQTLMSLLSSYDVLFSARCVKCKRVLPSEGYIPAVARSWVTSPELLEGAQEAKWVAFHAKFIFSIMLCDPGVRRLRDWSRHLEWTAKQGSLKKRSGRGNTRLRGRKRITPSGTLDSNCE